MQNKKIEQAVQFAIDHETSWSREIDDGITWAANSGDRNGLDAQSDSWVAANGPGKIGRNRLVDKELLAAQARERFNFSDGRDARDIRLGFGYQSRVARALSGSSVGGSSGSTYASASVLSTRETATAMFSSLVGTSRAGNVATGAFNAWLAAPEALSRPIETVSAIGSAAVQLAGGTVAYAGKMWDDPLGTTAGTLASGVDGLRTGFNRVVNGDGTAMGSTLWACCRWEATGAPSAASAWPR